MSRPRLLDLFCGAGGAARGYQLAGFHVTGVDHKAQPRYAGDVFIQGDALEYCREYGHEFDAIHASPPCQAHSSMRTMHNAKEHPELVEPTRELLQALGVPYVIENVPGAPMPGAIMLCGTMFGLGYEDAELRRHRLFESSALILAPPCQHGRRAQVVGVYGGSSDARRRRRTIGVYGDGVRDSVRKSDKGVADFTVEHGREAMGIDWMTLAELCQAIPPAYTEYIGRQLLRAVAIDDQLPAGAAGAG